MLIKVVFLHSGSTARCGPQQNWIGDDLEHEDPQRQRTSHQQARDQHFDWMTSAKTTPSSEETLQEFL